MSKYIFLAADNKLRLVKPETDARGYHVIIDKKGQEFYIYEDEPNYFSEPFTKLPVIYNVQIGSDLSLFETELFKYIKDAMIENETVELWHTWIGEKDNVQKEVRHIDDLSIDDIYWVFEDKECTSPRGLMVFKWRRRKK